MCSECGVFAEGAGGSFTVFFVRPDADADLPWP
jgi:hypothetical protein